MFGWTLIREAELKEYRRCAAITQTVLQCHRWFSGWKDLDIIWDYVLGNRDIGGIWETREEYAVARGTDAYGRPATPCTSGENTPTGPSTSQGGNGKT